MQCNSIRLDVVSPPLIRQPYMMGWTEIKTMQRGQLIGEGLTDAWNVDQLPPPNAPAVPQLNSISWEEYKFHWNPSI